MFEVYKVISVSNDNVSVKNLHQNKKAPQTQNDNVAQLLHNHYSVINAENSQAWNFMVEKNVLGKKINFKAS